MSVMGLASKQLIQLISGTLLALLGIPAAALAETVAGEAAALADGGPARRPLRLAVLGDSDSHAFHDRIALPAGGRPARGGAYQANTWQWTEILARLRPRDIDQGPFAEVGKSRLLDYLQRKVLGGLVRQHKEDFRYNFAFSGATCSALLDPHRGQVPALMAEMGQDARRWQAGPSVVVVRIGINSLGTRKELEAFAARGADDRNLAQVNSCADHVANALARLKAAYPALHVVLVGILNNVDWPPFHAHWQDRQAQANINAVLDVYDARLRVLAGKYERVEFFDDRAFFRRHFGARDADGKPAYKQLDLGGSRPVSVTQGDEPFHAVLQDGHAGTVWNGLWAGAMIERFNRIEGVDIPPLRESEVAQLADPAGRFGLWR